MLFDYDIAAVFLPLIGALFASLSGRRQGPFAASLAVAAATISSWIVFKDVALHGHAHSRFLADWISEGSLQISWGLRLDTLTAVLLLVVNTISTFVHVYAVGYMNDKDGLPRFTALLSLFTFFMLILVSADNLVQMFFGWEGVGLCSYLLIGFWYEKPSACKAGLKAFLVNRIGDVGFLLGIWSCFALFGSLQFDALFRAAPNFTDLTFNFMGLTLPALNAICLLLFFGAMGKSAQLGLHVWLPDAMEGPTPASALIHAATMVTAGVFMVARLSPMFEYAPEAMAVVAVIGALTALMAAVIGMTQFDIKRVIAYSTMSQLGYMFFALGVSAYSAAIFHLVTHAFFKALLFLGVGSVIHGLSGEQDMRKLGGLWHRMPITYALIWIGALALSGIGLDGVFGFAGFYSKDLILQAALASGSWYGLMAYAFGLITAFLTAFYSWRLIIMAFHGEPRGKGNNAYESSWLMLLPMLPLALGAIFAGWYAEDWFSGPERAAFWHRAILVLPQHDSITAALELPTMSKFVPLFFALSGMLTAYVCYVARPVLPKKIAAKLGIVYRIVCRKFYFDEIYDFLFVRPTQALAKFLWKYGDDAAIDGLGPDGIAKVAAQLSRGVCTLQSGYVYHYAFAMVIGLVLFVTWFFVRAGL